MINIFLGPVDFVCGWALECFVTSLENFKEKLKGIECGCEKYPLLKYSLDKNLLSSLKHKNMVLVNGCGMPKATRVDKSLASEILFQFLNHIYPRWDLLDM